MNRHRLNLIIAGAPRSGKTYYAEKLANNYANSGRIVLAYNVGLSGDFSDFEEVEFLDKIDTSKLLDKVKRQSYLFNPEIRLFKYKGKVYDMKYFVDVCKGKRLKSYRIADQQSEDLFFLSIYKYIKNCLIIFDDIRPVFRSGLKRGSINLFSRINHTGLQSKNTSAKNGVDVVLIFHNLDKVNSELYDYATHLIAFYCTRKSNKIGNEELECILDDVFEQLKSAEKYTYFEVDIRNLDISKRKPIS